MKQKRDLERVSKELEALRGENENLKTLHKPDNNNVLLVCFICIVDILLCMTPFAGNVTTLGSSGLRDLYMSNVDSVYVR